MGLMGFEFVEFASPTPGLLEPIFERMGFSLVARHRSKDVVLFRQGAISLLPQIYNAERFGVALEPYPTIRCIGQACRKLDAFQRAAPEAQPDAI